MKTCSKHENTIIKLNTAEQDIKNMKECLIKVKQDNFTQGQKIDKVIEQLGNLPWKIVGGIGGIILLSQIISGVIKNFGG